MDNGRAGRPVGGGLVFTNEFDRSKLLEKSDFFSTNLTRRTPIIIGDLRNNSWTVFGQVSFSASEDTNIFYIPTVHTDQQGRISLEIEFGEKINQIKFKVDDGFKSFYVGTVIKKDVTDIKFCCATDIKAKTISMWLSDGQVFAKTIKKYKFPPAYPRLIIWNKFGQVNIKECAGWFGNNNDDFSIKQKRLLTL